MASLSLPTLLPSILASCLLSLVFIPPGFLVAGCTNLMGFWQRSRAEQLLWSIALSAPVSTMLAVLTGRYLGPKAASFLFASLACGASALALVRRRQLVSGLPFQLRETRWLAVALLAAAAYLFIATAGVRIGPRLYEGAYSSDWAVRLPLQYSAAHSGVPPVNPLFSLAGRSPALRYYYFFYVLCGLPVRLIHSSPHAALVGGTIWSCLVFFSTAWLMLKYLSLPAAHSSGDPFAGAPSSDGPAAAPQPRVRPQALLFFVISAIMGLDIFAAAMQRLCHSPIDAFAESWRDDRSSTIFTALPLAPHHIIGIAFGLLAYLLLVLTPAGPMSARLCARQAAHILLATVAFAALVGTSSYMALGFALGTTLLGLHALLRRRWHVAAAITLTGTLAFLLDLPYILETFHTTSLPSSHQAAVGGHYLKLVLRNWHPAVGVTWNIVLPAIHLSPRPYSLRYFYALPALALLYLMELGFLWFVLWYRARQDLRSLRSRRTLGTETSALWCLFLAFTLMALFVSSVPTQGINDLGRQAGIVVRIILCLWACPLIAAAWHRYRSPAGLLLPRSTRLALQLAFLCGVFGLLGQIQDAFLQRFYLVLVDRGSPFTLYRNPGIALRYAAVHDAWQRIDHDTAGSALVQSNPGSQLQGVSLFYLLRRTPAGDVSCETAFGGDTAACLQANTRPLLALYAQSTPSDLPPPYHVTLTDPATRTPAAFAALCNSLQLTALIATDADPVWHEPASWVWHTPLLYADDYVRVLRCPAAPPL